MISADNDEIGIGPGIEYSTELERSVMRLNNYLVGKSPFEVEKFYQLFEASTWQYGTFLGCLDITLWDLIGKTHGEPIFKLLGEFRDTIKPYVSLGRLRSPQETVELVQTMKGQGFSAFKLRFHSDLPENELEVVRALRENYGDNIDIMVDGNQAFLVSGQPWTYETALLIAKELEKLGAYFLEEP